MLLFLVSCNEIKPDIEEQFQTLTTADTEESIVCVEEETNDADILNNTDASEGTVLSLDDGYSSFVIPQIDTIENILSMSYAELSSKYGIVLDSDNGTSTVYSSAVYYLTDYIDEEGVVVYFVDDSLESKPMYLSIYGDGLAEEQFLKQLDLNINGKMNFGEINEIISEKGFKLNEYSLLGAKYHQIYIKDNLEFIFVSYNDNGLNSHMYISKSGNITDCEYNKILDDFINNIVAAEYREDEKIIYYYYDELKVAKNINEYYLEDIDDYDNDGQFEMFLSGPFGGMIIDARDDKVAVLAKGKDNANVMGYAYVDEECWIVYADISDPESMSYKYVQYDKYGEIKSIINLYEQNGRYYCEDAEVSKDIFEGKLGRLFIN